MPSWIHTAEVAAWIGWLFQIVTPTLTRWRTQSGDVDAAGVMTLDGIPSGMFGCSCKKPSRSHNDANP